MQKYKIHIPYIYIGLKDGNNILLESRHIFTKNAVMIDKIMYYIKNNIEKNTKIFYCPLLVQASTNNNTNNTQHTLKMKIKKKQVKEKIV